MTRKQKEMTVENTTEQNEMQKKEGAPRDEVKQTENTTKEGKEKPCGFREHLKVHQTNSSDRFRPACKKTYDMISHDVDVNDYKRREHWFQTEVCLHFF